MFVESLKTGGLFSGGFRFDWAFGNYADAITGNMRFILRSVRIWRS